MSKILIIGCGYVGQQTAHQLLAQGHHVSAAQRKAVDLPPSVVQFPCDLSTPASLKPLPLDFDYILFAASPDRGDAEGYRTVYLDGMRHVLQHFEASSVLKRLLFLSSTSVYHQTDGSWVDEHSSTAPQHFSGQTILAVEQLLATSSAPTSALRCAGIYGPTRTRLVREVVQGTAQLPQPDRFTNRIHRDDIAGAIVHLIGLNAPIPDTLLLVDNDNAPYSEVTNFFADQLGCPRPTLRAPASSSRRGGNKRCSNQTLMQLGYSLRYPSFRDGYAPILADFRERQND